MQSKKYYSLNWYLDRWTLHHAFRKLLSVSEFAFYYDEQYRETVVRISTGDAITGELAYHVRIYWDVILRCHVNRDADDFYCIARPHNFEYIEYDYMLSFFLSVLEKTIYKNWENFLNYVVEKNLSK